MTALKHVPGSAVRRFCKLYELGPGECWTWIGNTVPRSDVGLFRVDGKTYGARVVSWVIHREAPPDGSRIVGSCDTAQCVNPRHMLCYHRGPPTFMGSFKQNLTNHQMTTIMEAMHAGEMTMLEVCEKYKLDKPLLYALRAHWTKVRRA